MYFSATLWKTCRQITAALSFLSTLLGKAPPLLLPLLGYILCVITVYGTGLPTPIILQISGLIIVVLLVYLRRPTRTLVLASAVFWGGIATWIAITPDTYHQKILQQIQGQDIALAGKVLKVEPQPGRWRMDVEIDTIHKNELCAEARSMLVRIHVAADAKAGAIGIYAGDHIRLRTKLSPPRLFGTPGEFNYPRYLSRRSIVASGFVANAAAIARMVPTKSPSISERMARWRQRTAQNIAKSLPQQSTAYLLSLALGEKTRLSPKQRQTLAFTGLSHLFSISGLHLGMIAAFTYALIQFFYRRSSALLLWQPVQKITPLLCLPFIVAYLVLTGSALPTVRATIMLSVAALLAVINQRTRPSAIFILAAALILVTDPLALFSASFQLSFAGVGALLFVLPIWHKRLPSGWKRWGSLLVLTSYTACLATTPFALWHFHTVAPAAVIVNILAVPVLSFIILPLSLSSTTLFCIAPKLGEPLLRLSSTLLMNILNGAETLATGPLAGRYLYLSLWGHGAVALLCTGLILWAARHRSTAFLVMSTVFIVLLLALLPINHNKDLRLAALSVGQGDAFLLQTPENKNYLIDGGGLYSATFDTGAQLVAPALQRLGVTHLDAVILSHDHPDHSKGLNHILRHFPTKVFLSGAQIDNLNPNLQETLRSPGAPVLITLPEGLLRLDTHVYLHTPDQTHREVNERSIAVFAGYGSEGLLLTGDLETHGMAQLLKLDTPVPVTLFKLPHHGSRNSLPEQWSDRWGIDHAFTSCGFNNHFGFPHTQVCNILSEAKIPLWRTDLHGSVQFITHGKGWEVKTWKRPLTNP